MTPRRIYPPVYIDRKDNKIYCCPGKHVCLSHGGTEALADQICPLRERYLRPQPSHYVNKHL